MATVGPASAACMIPRSADWPYGSSLITVNATESAFYPTTLSDASYFNGTATSDCDNMPWGYIGMPLTWVDDPSGIASVRSLQPLLANMTAYPANDNEGISASAAWSPYPQGAIPAECWSWDIDTVSYEFYLQAGNLDGEDWEEAVTSIPVPGVTGLVGSTRAWAGQDIHDSMNAYSKVHCSRQTQTLWHTGEAGPPIDFSVVPSLGVGAEIPNATAKSVYLASADYERIASALAQAQQSNELEFREIAFVDIPGSNASGAVIALPQPFFNPPYTVALAPCTFELGWLQSTVHLKDGVASSTGAAAGPDDHNIEHVTADKRWLDTANPWVPEAGSSAYQYLYKAVQVEWSASITLSALLTVTLARMSLVPQACGSFAIYGMESYVNRAGLGCDGTVPGGMTFPLHFSTPWYRSGYGYGPNVVTVKISLAILCLYCIVTVVHVGYSVWTGVSSSAWDSVVEVVALAMTSRPAEELRNTCAGIETASIFEHRVRIATTTGLLQKEAQQAGAPMFEVLGDHLELLFPSSEGSAVSTVKTDTLYGALKH